MKLCPLRHGPNGLMVIFLVITIVLTVRGIALTIIMISMDILLHCGEVIG
jgi:hypothetical protein